MIEFIICLIKYTSIFLVSLYAYTRLMQIKLKVWDLFDILIFAALSAILYFVTVYVKTLVPIGLLLFCIAFLFLRFRKTFYETVTVSSISLGLAILSLLLSFFITIPITVHVNFIKNENLQVVLAQIINSLVQVIGIFLLFKIKRFQSGIEPKRKNATFDILLYLSVICIFTLTLVYAEEVKEYMLKVVLLVIALSGLLLIVWWRRHITYNYREAVNRQNVNRMEDTIEEIKLNSVETDLQVAVYSKLFHFLNKAVPDCAYLAEIAAEKTGCEDACAARDMLRKILREMNIANEKCSLQNVPQTGERLIDVPIIQLFTVAERKSLNVSVDISADAKSWFSDGKLHKEDIHTLLSYLLDNAMISALGAPNAKVRLELSSTKNKKPLIRVYDSGEQFDEEVLAKLGLEQITTRAGTGGNGIGLFTVFEILAKYGASFTLDEDPQSFGFKKCIEIAFDGLCGFTVRTSRQSVAAACSARKGITVEPIDADGEEKRDGTNG